MKADVRSPTEGPLGPGEPPDNDEIRECSHEDCGAWRYSWLAMQFHQLREHVGGGR